MSNKKDDFFIGWSEETPNGYSKTSNFFVLILIPIILLTTFLLVNSQKDFSASTFEFGETTTIEGTLIKHPAPMLRLFSGNDLSGKPIFQHVLLVAFGKFGAGETLAAIEETEGDLDGQAVKLQGTLIYHDGKTTLELLEGTEGFIEKTNGKKQPNLPVQELGAVNLEGEIIDPKCFFGVMKPAEGKTHKSCAIRCISGGIPPVFAAYNNGQRDYYLILDEKGQSINEAILPYVASYLKLEGKANQLADWKVLYLDTKNICQLGPKAIFRDMPLCGNF